MKLTQIRRPIAEAKDKDFFSYVELSKEMWRKKVKDAQDDQNIHFDLENDYDVVQREIDIPQSQWQHTKCKFRCELYSAGGDWEDPVLYFRCQLRDGYAEGLNQDSYFIYIPPADEGNTNLVKNKKDGWRATVDDDHHHSTKKQDLKPNEYKAWQGLKKYLKKLVDNEIAEVRKDHSESSSDGS